MTGSGTGPEIVIRPACHGDIAESVDVLIGVAREPGGFAGWIDASRRAAIVAELSAWLKADRNAIFVAETGGRVIGSLHVLAGDGIGEVRINVEAAWRGRGAGGRMLAAAEAWARARSFRKLWLNVHAPNTKAIALYERAGYEHEGVQRQQYRHPESGEIWDTVPMGKLLAPAG